jgi:hypothetical protein
MSYISSKPSSIEISIMTRIRFDILTPISSNKFYACHEFQKMKNSTPITVTSGLQIEHKPLGTPKKIVFKARRPASTP